MKSSVNLRASVALAVTICLVLPVLSIPIQSKLYIVRNLKIDGDKDYLVGVEIGPDNSGKERVSGVFGALPNVWDKILRPMVPSDVTIEEVPIDKVPVMGLLEIIKVQPNMYSVFLPALLSRTSPKKVSENLPIDLFETLTPEEQAKIPPADLAELAKVYGR